MAGEAEILAAAVVAASSRSSYKFVTLADGALYRINGHRFFATHLEAGL